MRKKEFKLDIGWQEWVSLPTLKIPVIKAKIDTGAQTSSLHAFDIKEVKKDGSDFVSFKVHPLQKNNAIEISCLAPIIDRRRVMSSNGHAEKRYVIKSTLILGSNTWEIELTLSNRDPLHFRMLLGRQALVSKVTIDPSKTMCITKITKKDLQKFY